MAPRPLDSAPETEPAFSGVFSLPFLAFASIALVGGYAIRALGSEDAGRIDDAQPRLVVPRGDLGADERATIELFERAVPSVVHIRTGQVDPRAGRSGRRAENPFGSGSGVVWDQEGHVVTNYHVVHGADTAVVELHDGRQYGATLVGKAPDYDLAVLRIDAPANRLEPIPVGESSDLRVGQRVFAIGSPFDLDRTLTTGIISGLNRAITAMSGLAIRGVIQTDAAINPGNSGGPLLDSSGRLIGINTAIKSPSGVNAGVGFAVPVDTVNKRVPEILRDGIVERAGLGILVGPDLWAEEAGVQGAVIESVFRNTPAARSGLRGASRNEDGTVELGDIIVGVDDHEIRAREDLFRVLGYFGDGDLVRVRVFRGATIEEIDVRLAELR